MTIQRNVFSNEVVWYTILIQSWLSYLTIWMLFSLFIIHDSYCERFPWYFHSLEFPARRAFIKIYQCAYIHNLIRNVPLYTPLSFHLLSYMCVFLLLFSIFELFIQVESLGVYLVFLFSFPTFPTFSLLIHYYYFYSYYRRYIYYIEMGKLCATIYVS